MISNRFSIFVIPLAADNMLLYGSRFQQDKDIK